MCLPIARPAGDASYGVNVDRRYSEIRPACDSGREVCDHIRIRPVSPRMSGVRRTPAGVPYSRLTRY